MNPLLHRPDTGESYELAPVSIIGRSPECQVLVADPRVSRRHAMIRRQDGGYYLFDLGSFNGSYLNGSRVTATRLLRNGDVISFAEHEFHFEERGDASAIHDENLGGSTIALIRSTPVILLVSDVKGFTALSELVEANELAQIIGTWYSDCEVILSAAGATVDKFIGDCVLAYWTVINETTLAAALAAAERLLDSSERISSQSPEIFGAINRRFEVGVALHSGKVAYGGMSQGEFTLVGDPVNLVFRLESLTRSLGSNVLLSGDFVRTMPSIRPHCRSHGVQQVKGRAQGVEVFSLESFPPSV